MGTSDTTSLVQGRTIYGVANWKDNLTQPFQGALQFYNVTSGSWATLNVTFANSTLNLTNFTVRNINDNNGTWTNLSFPIP